MDTSSETSTASLTEYIQALHDAAAGLQGKLVLCGFDPEGDESKTRIRHFAIGDVEGMAATARELSQTHNAYCAPVVYKSSLRKNSRGKAEDIIAVLGIGADDDADKGKTVTLSDGVQPTFEIESSPGNRNLIFLFTAPQTYKDAKAAATKLHAKIGGEPGGNDANHVWRLPDTLNHPDEKKRDRGRSPEPHPVKLLASSAYRVDWKPTAEKSDTEAKSPEKKVGRKKTRVGPSDIDELESRFEDWLREAMKTYDAEDRSKHITDVSQNLMRRFVTDNELALLLEKMPFGAKFAERGLVAIAEEVQRQRSIWESEGRQSEPGFAPVVVIRPGQLSRMVVDAETILVDAGVDVFRVGQMLMRPVIVEAQAADKTHTKTAALTLLTEGYLHLLLSRHVRWRRYQPREGRWIDADVPDRVAGLLLSRQGEWTFPPLRAVITSPTLRPDGSVLSSAGYDADTQLYVVETVELPPMSAEPTREDAETALALLDRLLDEFPFIDDAARSVALSALITSVVRASLSTAPMHTISAHAAGTGKSYLVDLAGALTFGRRTPVLAASVRPEETDKTLSAVLLAGNPIVSLDNIEDGLRSSVLAQALSQAEVEIRILGQSRAVPVPNRAMIFATGNNIALIGDINRRALMCNLDAQVEQPELRTFSGNPFHEIIADRGRYIAAALTVVQAYVRAGRPGRLSRLGSFEDWSDNVRSALVWLGRADPASTIARAREEDPNIQTLALFLEAIEQEIGLDKVFSASEIIGKAYSKVQEAEDLPERYKHSLLHEAVSEVGTHVNSKRLGWWLRNNRGRVIGSLRLERRGTEIKGWYVRNIEERRPT